MNVKINTINRKTILFSCLLLASISLWAQNIGSHKYLISRQDSCATISVNIIEMDDYYYLLTDAMSIYSVNSERIPTVTVFDKSLNIVNKIKIFDGWVKIMPFSLFYLNNAFYLVGLHASAQRTKPYLMKLDSEFNTLQSPMLFMMDDSLEYGCDDVLMNSNNEFIYMLFERENIPQGRLLHVDTNGTILHDVPFPNITMSGIIVETDSSYFLEMGKDYLLRFYKNSMDKYDSLPIVMHEDDIPERNAIAVNNTIIRSNRMYAFHDECVPEGEQYPRLETDRSIVFLDTNMNVKNRLEFGKHCARDLDGFRNMNYIDPDSIYYAYETATYENGGWRQFSTISIANFSQHGHLNFNYTLDILEDISTKIIYCCKAVSDGGVLVCGARMDWNPDTNTNNGFILKYHPYRNDLIVKEFPLETEIKVFPNPAQSQFTVTNTENANIYLYNILGQEVKQVVGKEENTTIYTDNLPAGMYILKVLKENRIVTKKVQVVR